MINIEEVKNDLRSKSMGFSHKLALVYYVLGWKWKDKNDYIPTAEDIHKTLLMLINSLGPLGKRCSTGGLSVWAYNEKGNCEYGMSFEFDESVFTDKKLSYSKPRAKRPNNFREGREI